MTSGTISVRHTFQALIPTHTMMAVLSGPLAGLMIWLLPLQLESKVHKAFAIVGFMLMYWIAEPIDLGMTALMGCFLFWVLQVTHLQ